MEEEDGKDQDVEKSNVKSMMLSNDQHRNGAALPSYKVVHVGCYVSGCNMFDVM